MDIPLANAKHYPLPISLLIPDGAVFIESGLCRKQASMVQCPALPSGTKPESENTGNVWKPG